jgi:predicted component of type VI protein secretion system
VRARLKFTVDGNIRWLRNCTSSGESARARLALAELERVLAHLHTLGRVGRQRMVELCNAVVDADGLTLLHQLSNGKMAAVADDPDVAASATRLFRELVPLIWS